MSAATTIPTLSGSIAGTVRDAAGKPVAGATVWLDASRVAGGKVQQGKVVTLADGLYAFHFLPAGTFGVTVVPPTGYGASDADRGLLPTLTAGMRVTQADFALAASPVAKPANPGPIVTPTPTPTPVAVPVTPGPTPTASGILCGMGPAGGSAMPVYTVNTDAGAWFDCRTLADNRFDLVRWDFGEAAADPRPCPLHAVRPDLFPTPTYDANTDRGGLVVHHVYTTPGPRTVTLRVYRGLTGTTDVYTQAVNAVTPARTQFYFGPGGNDANAGTDPASPKLSAAAFFAVLNGASNVRVTVNGSLAGTLPAGITLGSNVVVDGLPDAAGNRPALNGGAFTIFSLPANDASRDVLIRGFAPTSPQTVDAGGKPCGTPNAKFITVRGYNVCVHDCPISGWLDRFDEVLSGSGAGFDSCHQPDGPPQIRGEVSSDWGGGPGGVGGGVTDRLDCTYAGSMGESPRRQDGQWAGHGATLEAVTLRQTGQAYGNGKAPHTTRNADVARFYRCVVDGVANEMQDGVSSTIDEAVNFVRDVAWVFCLLNKADFSLQSRAARLTIRGVHCDPFNPRDPHTTIVNDPSSHGAIADVMVAGDCTSLVAPWRNKDVAGAVVPDAIPFKAPAWTVPVAQLPPAPPATK